MTRTLRREFLFFSVIQPPFDFPQMLQDLRGEPFPAAPPELARKAGQTRGEGSQKHVGPPDPDGFLEEVPAPERSLGEEHSPREIAGADPDLVPIEVVGPAPA